MSLIPKISVTNQMVGSRVQWIKRQEHLAQLRHIKNKLKLIMTIGDIIDLKEEIEKELEE